MSFGQVQRDFSYTNISASQRGVFDKVVVETSVIGSIALGGGNNPTQPQLVIAGDQGDSVSWIQMNDAPAKTDVYDIYANWFGQGEFSIVNDDKGLVIFNTGGLASSDNTGPATDKGIGTLNMLNGLFVNGVAVQVNEIYTFATLPVASATTRGLRVTISDGSVTLSGNFAATAVGGGAIVTPVFCNGSAWLVG